MLRMVVEHQAAEEKLHWASDSHNQLQYKMFIHHSGRT